MEQVDWTLDEVEQAVDAYFAMLELDLRAVRFNKAERNRQLQARTGRTRESIEFKLRNISAVLANFGQPTIRGYAPATHIQRRLLEPAVLSWLEGHPGFFDGLVEGPVISPVQRQGVPPGRPLSRIVEQPPDRATAESDADAAPRLLKIDFAKRDEDNRRLGRLGEQFVVDFEQRRLVDELRRPELAKRVEWISATRGDGVGYDIASFNADGTPRLIEVKTTGLSKHHPFIVTRNEVRVSERQPEAFQLYRVFEFAHEPRLYMLPGPLTTSCALNPTQYRARARASG